MPKNVAPLISWHGEHARVPLPIRVLWRYFVTAQALRGPGDNATFLHAATIDYRARPYTKLTGPTWQRLCRRHAAVTAPLNLLAAAPWHGLWPTLTYLCLLLTVSLVWAVRAVHRALAGRRRNREWIDPAAKVACSVLGQRYTKRRGRRMIELPAEWGTGAEGGETVRQVARVHIPAGTALTKSVRLNLENNLAGRLGIPLPVQAEWSEAGPSAFVDLSAAPVPPREVTWASLLPVIRAADPETMIVGRTAGGRLTSVSLTEDSPHIAMSGPSGTGKSVLARVLVVPRVALHGDGLLITDPKKFSHWRWAGDGKVDKRRIRYAWRTEDLHQAWLDVAAEMARRIELDESEHADMRRVFVLIEEINTQTRRLQRYWRGVRKQIIAEAKLRLADDPAADIDLGDLDPPLQSPAIVAMQELVGMGRELKMHAVAVAQRLSASVFGGNGGDVRESFQGGRLIAKWDRRLWRMLVDTIDYVACPSGPRGIWGLARGEDFDIARVPFLSERDALAMVTDSAVPVSGPVLGEQTGRAHVDADRSRLALAATVTLAEALDLLPGQDGPDSITLARLRRASTEDSFPLPVAKKDGSEYGRTEARRYVLAELIEWRELVRA